MGVAGRDSLLQTVGADIRRQRSRLLHEIGFAVAPVGENLCRNGVCYEPSMPAGQLQRMERMADMDQAEFEVGSTPKTAA